MAQEIDGFTAGLMLDAISKNPEGINEMATLYKQLKGSQDGGPSPEAIRFFEENKGKIIKVKHTSYHGEVYKLNEATGGFYPGSREPIYIRITAVDDEKWAKVVGQVFSYSLDQLELVEKTISN